MAICEWVPMFKVIEFYTEVRDKENIVHFLIKQPEFKMEKPKTTIVIEEIEVETSSRTTVKPRKRKIH